MERGLYVIPAGIAGIQKPGMVIHPLMVGPHPLPLSIDGEGGRASGSAGISPAYTPNLDAHALNYFCGRDAHAPSALPQHQCAHPMDVNIFRR
ncbi:hypothetical protein TI04_10510 [Achromatium sp. WMS2]|nr:hypothetical protein TI04_10510 [Achromatium sp. WMS2]